MEKDLVSQGVKILLIILGVFERLKMTLCINCKLLQPIIHNKESISKNYKKIERFLLF